MIAAPDSTMILRRVIDPDRGTMPPDLARFVLDLDFPPGDHARFEALSAKAQLGGMTSDEAAELDSYLHVDNLLAILRLKAQRSLAHGNSAE